MTGGIAPLLFSIMGLYDPVEKKKKLKGLF